VVAPGYAVTFPNHYWQRAGCKELPAFKDYIEGKYMPPLKLRHIPHHVLHPVFGDSFGLFATEDIPKDVLMGEYAADLLNAKDLCLCKKQDSVMHYAGSSSPEVVYLAPKDYAGLVTLINTGDKQKQNNCKSRQVVIEGALRITILTQRLVKKGEELLYRYVKGFKVDAK
jgi:hypothetical protein